MKTKFFALLLALVMVCSMALSVSAAETETGTLILDVGNGKGTVTVDVYLQGSAGVTNGIIVVEYDASVLTLAEVEVSKAYAYSSLNTEEEGAVLLAWVGSDLTDEKTLMMTLTLEVAEGTAQALTYSAYNGGIYDADGEAGTEDTTVTVGFDAAVNTAALEDAIAKAQAIDPAGYTADSYTVLKKALEAGLAVLADADATQAEVNAATKALQSALAALEEWILDTTELEAAIAAAEALNESLYTEESFQAVEAALEEAKAVLVDPYATQDDMDAAAITLRDAIADLKKVGGAADTADTANILLWMLVLVLSLAGCGSVMVLMIRSGKTQQVKRFLSLVLVTAMLLSFAPLSAVAIVVGEDNTDAAIKSESLMENLKDLVSGKLVNGEDAGFMGTIKQLFDLKLDLKQESTVNVAEIYEADQLVRVLVELEGDCLLDQGYTMNQIAAAGVQVSADAIKLETVQQYVIEQILAIAAEAKLGEATVKYTYTAAFNGMAITVPYGILPQIRALENVKGAYLSAAYNAPEATASDVVYDPNMYATKDSFGSAQTWEDLGYSGEGMLIAVIDTGLDVDHPSFADTPEGACLTLSDVEAVLEDLNAYTLFNEISPIPLTADALYHNGKVPFGFNYVDASVDVTHDFDTQGDHGTHVAGIAAANKMDTTEVVGVAHNAQLVIMKVFGQNGGAFSEDILAAIEDCILLGVDAINMSLGAQAGFSEDSVLINEVYGRILQEDMILAIAGGNANSAATGNTLGTNLNLTQDPDNGLVNSPATYLAATTVASLENVAMMMPYFSVGEHRVAYNDVTYYNFSDMAGTYQYVIVPGVGDVSDYEGLDLNGKIAVVQRGTIDFESKQRIAANAGAVALVVYDNVEGDLLWMYDGGYLPNVFISKADGEKMIAEAVDGEGFLTIHPYGVQTAIPSPNAGLLSDFSCWGVTPDLQLVPDVTAPGGNIYSTYTDGAYGTMSGTSMACPHIAGMSALVLQYLHDQYPDLEEADYHVITESLIMSTAVPVVDPYGVLYSPRKQGAGSANVYSAITSPVYLTSYQEATGELTPKASMGDDPQRTGVFSFSFDMNNLTGTEQVYSLEGMLLTEDYIEYEGNEYMSETGRNLSGTVTFEILDAESNPEYDFNGDGRADMDDVQFMLDAVMGHEEISDAMEIVQDEMINTRDAQALYELLLAGFEPQTQVTVPANGSVTVKVTVKLSKSDMAYMNAHFENGIYVDGFVRAYAETEGAVDLCLPLMGFYGGWDEARMFDNGWYYDEAITDDDPDNDYYYNRYINVVFATLGDYVSTFGGLGINPYVEEPYDPEHNVLSPNGDMYHDFVPDIYVSLMRSAELLDFTWTDDATGEELFYEWYAYARKSYYWSGYGMCLPAIYTDGGCQPFTFLDENGDLLVEDLQHLTLTIRGYLDDGDLDDIGYTEDGDPIPDKADADEAVEIPVVIDLKAPTINMDSMNYFTEDGRSYVSFEVEDNYDLAAVVLTTSGGGAYEYIPVEGKQPGIDGEKATVTLDITDCDSTFRIVLCDYGCNESYYELANVSNDGLSEDQFYAFRRYSYVETNSAYYITDSLNGWYSFIDAGDMLMHTSQTASGEPTVFAAEYVDGYIFGAQAGESEHNTFFVMKAGSWERMDLGSERAMNKTVYEWPGRDDYTYFPLKMVALDMAYDYTTDTMYVLANAYEHERYFPEGEINILLSLDLHTGDVNILGKIFPEGDESLLALTLACDNDGVLYTINSENGKLYTINKTPTETTPQYGYGTYVATCVNTEEAQYFPAAYTQAMTVDHATNKLYWAGYQGIMGKSYFMELDKATGKILTADPMENNAEMSGLFKPWESGKDIIPGAELAGISLREDALYLNVGLNATIIAKPEPYNATLGTLSFESLNEDVAVVSPYGIVEAKGVGAAEILVTCTTEDGEEFTTTCTVNVSAVSGTLFAYSDPYWMLMDAGMPDQANQVVDAMELVGEVKAAAYREGWLYVAAVEEGYDEDYNTVYTTNFYKLDANTLQGELIGTIEGDITALAFNYADGFLYALRKNEGYDAKYNWSIRYELLRVNMRTAQTITVTDLDALYPCSDRLEQYTTCSGALAIDYEGNFYVNGDNTDYEYNLIRFRLNEQDEIVDIVEFTGFEEYGYSGDAMVWSQRNGGLIRVSGNTLSWVDVSNMEEVVSVSLGQIRGAGYNTFALAVPLLSEPAVEGVTPTDVFVEESYTVPEGETVKIVPTVNPWNAAGEFTFTVADETIASVDEDGVVTGRAIGQTTITVSVVGTDLRATTTLTVTENPGYLYGYFQGNLVDQIPLEAWGKIPLSNPNNFTFLSDLYDLTIYAGAFYDNGLYAVGQHNSNGKYYMLKISPTNFTYRIVAEADLLIRDMAFDYTTGTMYAVAYNETVKGGLYQMDLDTMDMILVADNDQGARLVTLACDDQGVLYTATESGKVYTIDKDDAELHATGIAGPYSPYLQSMAYDYNNDIIYWAVGGTIYNVDVEKGEAISVGTTGCSISSLFSVPKTPVEVPQTVDPAGVVMAEKNTVAVGDTLAIDAVVLPVSVATVDQTLTWTSSDPSVATVDDSGVITGVSAGEVTITATDAKGNSDSIFITVTAERRFFYGYDELSNSWVKFDASGMVQQTWKDAEGLSPIVAAQYIGDVLYAYDRDGFFYTVDTETFQRTLLGDGIHGVTTSLEAWDNTHDKQVYYVDNVPYIMVDLDYSVIEGRGGTVTTLYGVMMAWNISDWLDDFSYKFVELDLQTGEITNVIAEDKLVDDMSLRPSNLLYRADTLWTINGFISGHITSIDPVFGDIAGHAICPEYWGDFNGGRSMIEDPLTGQVYAIRDKRPDYIGTPGYEDLYSTSELCTMELGVGKVDKVCNVGANMRIVGLFIK